MIEPFPENLPTIPACFECNNGYSEDEKYLACFLDVLKSNLYADYSRKDQTNHRLEKDKNLQALLVEQIKVSDGKVYYELDEERFLRILVKLARGHAGFEFDYVNFDDTGITVSYNFLFEIAEDVMSDFNQIPEIDIAPEVCSRGITAPCIMQNIETDEAFAFAFWNEVQDNQYRYQVTRNKNGGICVKFVIYEFLYCKIEFE